jgi:hypothetical protein
VDTAFAGTDLYVQLDRANGRMEDALSGGVVAEGALSLRWFWTRAGTAAAAEY